MSGDDVHPLELAEATTEVAEETASHRSTVVVESDEVRERPIGREVGLDVGNAVVARRQLRLLLRPKSGDVGVSPRGGLERGHATRVCSTEVKNPSPSTPARGPFAVSGPKPSSDACSGCGIRPTTFPAAFVTPAMSRREPFGFQSW